MGVGRCSCHAYPQPEWGSRGAAATLILNLNGGWDVQRHAYPESEVGKCSCHAYPQPEWGSRGAAATLILNLNGGWEVQLSRLFGGREAQLPRLS